MEQVERPDQPWIGLEELPRKSLHGIGQDEGMEAMLDRPAPAFHERRPIDGEEERHRQRFIDLHRVTRDAVAQIDAPREPRRHAISLVGEAGEQAPPAANDDAERKRNDEWPAGRAAYAVAPF